MDDMMSKIQAMLSDPESMNQIKQLADMLGNSASAPPQQNSSNTGSPGGNATQNNGSMPDLSALLAGLSGGASQQNNNDGNANQNSGNMPDLSALLAGLGNLGGGSSQQNSGGGNGSGGLGFDMNTLLQFQGLFQMASAGDKNSDLLMALRPHLKEDKHKKLDQAVKILKLLALWDVVKESGLLKSFDDLL